MVEKARVINRIDNFYNVSRFVVLEKVRFPDKRQKNVSWGSWWSSWSLQSIGLYDFPGSCKWPKKHMNLIAYRNFMNPLS